MFLDDSRCQLHAQPFLEADAAALGGEECEGAAVAAIAAALGCVSASESNQLYLVGTALGVAQLAHRCEDTTSSCTSVLSD